MNAAELKELATHEPFEPFRIRLSNGDAYTVRDPQSIAIMKSRAFLALPGGDEWVFISYLHIAAVESAANGHARGRARRKRRR